MKLTIGGDKLRPLEVGEILAGEGVTLIVVSRKGGVATLKNYTWWRRLLRMAGIYRKDT